MSEAAADLATDPELNLIDAIYARSVRGYLDREAPRKVLDRFLKLPGNRPRTAMSSRGKYTSRPARSRTACGIRWLRIPPVVPPNPDYEYRGDFVDEYRKRQVECAVALYSNMGIERGDKDGRSAPSCEILNSSTRLTLHLLGWTEVWDYGCHRRRMWAQTLMLTMVAFGLHSCPMGTMRNYPDMVREALGSRMAQKFCLASVLVTRTRQWQPMRPERPAIRSQPTW